MKPNPLLTCSGHAFLDIHEPAPVHNGRPMERTPRERVLCRNPYLGGCLRNIGIDVELITPRMVTPMYTATRVLFNETLRWRHFGGDATIGIDADGYAIGGGATGRPHIACIKGVLGDAVRFERGVTRASMAFQARLEAKHARRAARVITVSQYCVGRLEELYGVTDAVVVPELIDLVVGGGCLRQMRLFPIHVGSRSYACAGSILANGSRCCSRPRLYYATVFLS